MRVSLIIAGVILAAIAAGAGIAVYQTYWAEGQIEESAPGAASVLPDFSFDDLDGRQRRANEWMGKVLILNFWATWCPPCLKEVPTFVEYQQLYRNKGLQFVGIAVDRPQAVRDFVDSFAVGYPILIGDTDAVELSKTLGNRFGGLPFTVVFDREGRVRFRHAGEITAGMLDSQVLPLLEPDS
jgi:thiol-disulfide isomerase/thioredoxin